MRHPDGFVAAAPTAHRAACVRQAGKAAHLFRAFGAFLVVETWGDSVPQGEPACWPLPVQGEEHETEVFPRITWPSKDLRDAAWANVMEDPACRPKTNPCPPGGTRPIYGG